MTLIELARKLRPIIEKSAQNLDDATALEAVNLFPAWAAGVAFTAGTKVKAGGGLYSVVQDHPSQARWVPVLGRALGRERGQVSVGSGSLKTKN